MDIGLKTEHGHFSLRSAALIIEDNRLLLIKNDKLNCFYTVGGGVQENETSEQAVIREVYEETGYHIEADRLLFIQERFYSIGNDTCHEVVFFYLIQDSGIKIVDGTNTDQQCEMLYWVPVKELEEINLLPPFLKTALKNIPSGLKHIVSYE